MNNDSLKKLAHRLSMIRTMHRQRLKYRDTTPRNMNAPDRQWQEGDTHYCGNRLSDPRLWCRTCRLTSI